MSTSIEARIVEVTAALNASLAIEAERLGVGRERNPYRLAGCGTVYTTVYQMDGGRRSVEVYVSNGAGGAWHLATFDSAASFFRTAPLLGHICGFFRIAVERARPERGNKGYAHVIPNCPWCNGQREPNGSGGYTCFFCGREGNI